MATLDSYKNRQQSLAWVTAFIVHVVLLIFFFIYHIQYITQKPAEEFAGVSVMFGDELAGMDDATIGSEELINDTETATNQSASTLKADEEPSISTETSEVTVKKNNDVKTKNTNPTTNTSANKTSNTTSANTTKTNDDDLNKKKSQFGSLFGRGNGNGGEQGNQGSNTGDPNGKVLAGISTGTGRVGGGLSNRNIIQAPTVNESSQKTGKVVVKVCVDKNGKVFDATFTQKGSTTTDSHLVSISEKAAKKYIFASGQMDQQCGTITFDYKLN